MEVVAFLHRPQCRLSRREVEAGGLDLGVGGERRCEAHEEAPGADGLARRHLDRLDDPVEGDGVGGPVALVRDRRPVALDHVRERPPADDLDAHVGDGLRALIYRGGLAAGCEREEDEECGAGHGAEPSAGAGSGGSMTSSGGCGERSARQQLDRHPGVGGLRLRVERGEGRVGRVDADGVVGERVGLTEAEGLAVDLDEVAARGVGLSRERGPLAGVVERRDVLGERDLRLAPPRVAVATAMAPWLRSNRSPRTSPNGSLANGSPTEADDPIVTSQASLLATLMPTPDEA